MKELTIIEILNGHEPQLLRSHQSCEFCPVEVLLEYLHGTFAPDAMKGTRMSDASEIQVKMETLVQDIVICWDSLRQCLPSPKCDDDFVSIIISGNISLDVSRYVGKLTSGDFELSLFVFLNRVTHWHYELLAVWPRTNRAICRRCILEVVDQIMI